MKTLSALVFALVLSIAFSSFGYAQDAMKKETKEVKKQELKSVSCSPECGFMVRSHDETELVDAVKLHAKKQHGKEMSNADVKGMMKTEMMDKMPMKEDKKEMK